MFGTWILNMNARLRNLTLVGIDAIIWAIWLSRNDIAFDKKPIPSYMQIIYRGTLDKNMITV
jgi:hypothetical protein